jgi:transcriptional regulator of heat shock response
MAYERVIPVVQAAADALGAAMDIPVGNAPDR